MLDKAEKQKISEDNELLEKVTEILTSIEAIREETEKEVANSVDVTKARELMEKILESGVIFEEYNVMKAMFEKKPKAKQVGVKSRSQKITDSQVLRELIEECDKDSDVLDEATKELLIEKKQVILDWLDGKKDFNANKIDDIEIEEIASLLDLLKSLKATISEEKSLTSVLNFRSKYLEIVNKLEKIFVKKTNAENKAAKSSQKKDKKSENDSKTPEKMDDSNIENELEKTDEKMDEELLTKEEVILNMGKPTQNLYEELLDVLAQDETSFVLKDKEIKDISKLIKDLTDMSVNLNRQEEMEKYLNLLKTFIWRQKARIQVNKAFNEDKLNEMLTTAPEDLRNTQCDEIDLLSKKINGKGQTVVEEKQIFEKVCEF